MHVLFVSKPIAPPFHDGTRCFVRDLATHLPSVSPTVLAPPHTPPPGPGVSVEPVYAAPGSFAPALADNARVLLRLLLGSRHDLWHFVFAPNPSSSAAARLAVSVRRVPALQTVPSVPRTFEGVHRLLFGNLVVCQSRSTRDRFVAAGAPPARLEVIPPPLSAPESLSEEERRSALEYLGIPRDHGPLLVYPGDLEFSSGAQAVAQAAPTLLAEHPEATVIFACRPKTPRARKIERLLRTELAPLGRRVIFAGQVPSLPALLSSCRAVLFPVDDLYGKVDLPLSLLEAQALGVPVIALQTGPLQELEGAVPLKSPSDLARVCGELLRDEKAWQQHRDAGQAAVKKNHNPSQIAAAYEELYRKIARQP
ncbi:MAG: glycosyltransferase family 4 protein [Myxococcales bacterium]|nr:glycosyltransferase family 4 protein [Polyangiaceae bacterium]MDW8248371.1 glycosyltransferase family 4 protein [Myxococcales bacterium]